MQPVSTLVSIEIVSAILAKEIIIACATPKSIRVRIDPERVIRWNVFNNFSAGVERQAISLNYIVRAISEQNVQIPIS